MSAFIGMNHASNKQRGTELKFRVLMQINVCVCRLQLCVRWLELCFPQRGNVLPIKIFADRLVMLLMIKRKKEKKRFVLLLAIP